VPPTLKATQRHPQAGVQAGREPGPTGRRTETSCLEASVTIQICVSRTLETSAFER